MLAALILAALVDISGNPVTPSTNLGAVDTESGTVGELLDLGGGKGVDTNAVRDIVREQLVTNGIRSVDGAARPLPKYLWLYNADDSYPDSAQEYYRSRGNGKTDGGCSAVRSGGFLYRNFDFPFDDRAEFVVRMSAGPAIEQSNNQNNRTIRHRFASVGVAQVGTNLTERMVTSGKPEYSRLYKWLPGATVDGINENGVACNINVVDGDPQTSGWHNDTGDLHPLAAVRWILDNATNAQHAAEYIAANIRFPHGWTQNFHYMVASADPDDTWIVENGRAVWALDIFTGNDPKVMTNFRLYPRDDSGAGQERFNLLYLGSNIMNAWYTHAYRRETNPPWVSDLADVIAYTNEIFDAWASHPKEYFRGQLNNGQPWWQTVHTSVYDLTNRTLRVAVQETDDWYVFAVPSAGGTDEAKVREIASEVVAPVASSVSGLQSSKANRAESGDADEIATLDADGNPTRSGIANGDVITASSGGTINNNLTVQGLTTANAGLAVVGGLQVTGELSIENATDLTAGGKPIISATDQTFSNEVVKVQMLSLSTNITAEVYIAATNACANLGIDPALIPQGGTLGTVGGLLIALAAAVALLRKKTALLENDGKATETFATDLLGKQVAISAIDARLPYPINTDGTIKDRAINVVTSGAFVIPEGFHDLLIRYTGVPASLTFSGTDASIADYGDDLSTETGDYLVTVTRTKAAECYIRIIKLEARA